MLIPGSSTRLGRRLVRFQVTNKLNRQSFSQLAWAAVQTCERRIHNGLAQCQRRLSGANIGNAEKTNDVAQAEENDHDLAEHVRRVNADRVDGTERDRERRAEDGVRLLDLIPQAQKTVIA